MRFARTGIRASRVAFAVMLVIAALGAPLPSAFAQSDDARFAALLAARNGPARLAGPFSGELIQVAGTEETSVVVEPTPTVSADDAEAFALLLGSQL